MIWEKLPISSRITAVHLDIMKCQIPAFAQMGGTVVIGKAEVISDGSAPTAATNGRDVYYGEAFMQPLSRKQTRYLVLHENFHKALKHCVEYKDIKARFPANLVGASMDYSINQLIEEADPGFNFVERPTTVPPLVDKKFAGMGWIEILRELLKNKPPQGGQGKGKGAAAEGDGEYELLDEHIEGSDEMSEAEVKDVVKQLDDAIEQGKILAARIAGSKSSNSALDGMIQQRKTDWRRHVREFVQQCIKGDDMSRYIPPNKRMLGAGYLLPSHFTLNMGELIIACDTSGSMGGIYPVVFGEIAAIARTARPDSVRVIWWDSRVQGEEVYKLDQFDHIAGLLKPKGGGGTTPACVPKYIHEKKYAPKAVIMLTDGYLGGESAVFDCPTLWGIVDNERFVAPAGKVVHLNSINL